MAVLEWNDHGDFERMKSFCGKTDCTGGFWRLLGVDYFPRAGRQELAACINGAYHRILIDYGVWNTDSRAECTRCERKALVGSLTEWQAGTFLDLIRSETWKQEEARGVARSREWELFTAFGSEETRRSVEKEFKMAVRRIPFSTDAFVITGVDLQFFQFGIY